MAKEKKYKPRKNGTESAVTAILTIVIVVVLGLSVYSIAGKVKDKKSSAANGDAQQTENQPLTVEKAAEEKGLSVDEFIAQYGLDGVKAEDSMSDAMEKMTTGNYAKYSDKDFADFAEENKLPDSVTEDTPWTEARKLIPIGITMGGNDQFEQIKTLIGLDDSITADTPSGEAEPVIQQKYTEYLQAQQAAQSSESASEGASEQASEAASETASEEAK